VYACLFDRLSLIAKILSPPFLGHKSLKSTETYMNIEHTLFEAGVNDQSTIESRKKPEEIKELLEAGFEYVCQKDTLIFLRKRK
jgi:hypothetical protein